MPESSMARWKANTQLTLVRRTKPGNRGGKRPGAGRKRDPRSGVPHRTRAGFKDLPVHVTLRVLPDVTRLRRRKQHAVIRQSLARCCLKAGFRIVHYSIQGTHLHLLCEALTERDLARGVQGFASSVARRINRSTGRRGKVFRDRYHAHHLRSMREVRNAHVYVLNNWRKHDEHHDFPAWRTDPFSSADAFAHWTVGRVAPFDERAGPAPVAPPTNYMLRNWRRHYPPIAPTESPVRS